MNQSSEKDNFLIGFQHHQAGRLKEAEAIYSNILQADPNHADTLHLLGVVSYQTAQHDQAEYLIRRAIQISPQSPHYFCNLGNVLKAKGNIDEALSCYRRALEIAPNYAEAYFNMGVTLRQAGKFEQAVSSYKKALEIRHDYAEACQHIGGILDRQGNAKDAIAWYQKAVELRPNYAEAYNDMGIAYKRQGDWTTAVSCYQKAININPDFPLPHYNMGNILKDQARIEEAVTYYRRTIQLKPDMAHAYSMLVHQLQYLCEWEEFESLIPGLEKLTEQALKQGIPTPETPLMSLTRNPDPEKNYIIAKSWGNHLKMMKGMMNDECEMMKKDFNHSSFITIGYLSADFRNHPVAHLMKSVFRLHNRDEFKIHCYSYGSDDGSDFRKYIAQTCDKFVDLRTMSDKEAAKCINEDRVDILVDLMGHTGGINRLSICSLRPAPIQVTWLGFPGTTGADFIDYILTDKIATPETQARFFTEKLLYLPHTFMVTDNTQPIANTNFKRSDFGLPEHGIVFCAFNQSHKIEPKIFDIWMRILQKVPQSVLWLKVGNKTAEKNLKNKANERGIPPFGGEGRIIFANQLADKSEHLRRIQLADLALDTRIYNGGSTTIDTLWAGVPVITLQGSHTASRVSSSVLHAAGMPELVTRTPEEYENLAVYLAQHPEKLNAIRQKLAQNRLTAPLFDTPRFVRDLENAFKSITRPPAPSFFSNSPPQPPSLFQKEGEFYQRTLLLRAVELHKAGKLQEASQIYEQILNENPNHSDALHLWGMAAYYAGNLEQAVERVQKAIRVSPNQPLYYKNLGIVYSIKKQTNEAVSCYQKAIELQPNDPDTNYHLGQLFQSINRNEEALACFQKAIALKPDHVESLIEAGSLLRLMKKFEDSISCYQKALKINPERADAYHNMGVALLDMGKPDEAISAYLKAIQLNPNQAETYVNVLFQLQQRCEWEQAESIGQKLDTITRQALAKGEKAPEHPFVSLTRETDLKYRFLVAKSWSDNLKMMNAECRMMKKKFDHSSFIIHHSSLITIGYLSGDFRNHPVAHLIAGLFALHNRHKFRVICYSYGENDQSIYRKRIETECDEFVDLSGLTDSEAAARIHADNIDILIDLMGHTNGSRLGICAFRPAKIQITWLGYPGTTGADFFDYILADRIVVPENHAQFYSEKIIYLPNCYQINDHTQPIADDNIKRENSGLPERAFVFCSFNQPYKIEPKMFDVWMNILRKVPASVLWLLVKDPVAENNLRAEAEKRGIDPGRLIFAQKLPKDAHLSRHRFADLALDTRIVNGHTTTSDALWAGVPVITLQGDHFISRAASSILTAAGLPELVTRTTEEYENLAIYLAKHPEKLSAIRQKLAQNRLTAPLFDTPRFVRDLEKVFQSLTHPPAPLSLKRAGVLGGEFEKALQYHREGKLQEASEIYEKLLSVNPDMHEALHMYGLVMHQTGNRDRAVELIQKAIDLYSENPAYHANLAAVFQSMNHYESAISACQNALKIKPDFLEALFNIGMAFHQLGKFDDAVSSFSKALKIVPNHAGIYLSLGNSLKALHRFDEAISCFQKVLQIDPRSFQAYNNMGNILYSHGNFEEAVSCYREVLKIKPDAIRTYINLAGALYSLGKLDYACYCYRKIAEISPEQVLEDSMFIHLLQHTCAWKEIEKFAPAFDEAVEKALKQGKQSPESPFVSLTRHDNPERNFQVAQSWSDKLTPNSPPNPPLFGKERGAREEGSEKERAKGESPIIIGYLSNDFCNHPTAHLMLGLFRLHDRHDFKIYCYSYGRDDGSIYRKKIQENCDRFIDIRGMSDKQAAELIYADKVGILVDLKGHTTGNRLGICALRPAPIQVSYLGFPGSTGASFFDYFITDRIVTPNHLALYFNENLVYMPHCYQINDNRQTISEKKWTKPELGLPEDHFVFCSFNLPYKIDTIMFDIWMNILRRVPKSVLWLLGASKTAIDNLMREAEHRGIRRERLVFADYIIKSYHLSRQKMANLALDTRIVNGHTTTSDALWTGLPVITLEGKHFASRVSSSLLKAIGLPELVTKNLEEYENLAVRLAQEPEELKAITRRLEQNRLTEPLFDTQRFTRNLETAFREMWKIFFAGEKPRKIEVLEKII